MRCDMCGVEDELKEAIVEGAIISVCGKCAKFGIPIKSYSTESKVEVPAKKRVEKEEEEVEFIVDKYSEMVKRAREKKLLKQEELAKMLGERDSVIHAVESGSRKPDFKLAKKLEVFLDLKLIDKTEIKRDVKKEIDFKDGSLTIGDLLKG